MVMRAQYFIEEMIKMVNEADRELFVKSSNLDK